MSAKPLPCPFCGAELIANDDQADMYVRRYGTHYYHPSAPCFWSDGEVTPAEIDEWNRRAPVAPGATRAQRLREAGLTPRPRMTGAGGLIKDRYRDDDEAAPGAAEGESL